MKARWQHHKSKDGRLGAVAFADDQLHFLAGYTKCEHCSTRLKIMVNPDEARELGKLFGGSKPSLKARIAIRIQKWAIDV